MKWILTIAEETVEVDGNPMPELDRLYKKYGRKPEMVRAPEPAPKERPATIPVPPAPTTPSSAAIVPLRESPREGLDPIGQLRSTLDAQQAEASGFSLAQPLFTRGTRVNDTGVNNARTSRLEHDALPLASQAHRDLAVTIRGELRKDFVVKSSSLLLLPDGRLTTRDAPEKGILLSSKAFPQLVAGLDIPRGGGYLTACPAGLRSVNVNHWVQELARREVLEAGTPNQEAFAQELKLRMRGPKGAREIYAVTGSKYPSFDASLIAEAVAQAAPEKARGTVSYDGYRARGDVLFHSTVQPEHYVAGEIFRAGVSWSTDDTGGGSIVCRASVWQNLCLNLLVIDRSDQEALRLRHQGSVERLAESFAQGFKAAMSKIDHFVEAWDCACEEAIPDSCYSVDNAEVPSLRQELIAAAVRGMLDQKLVTVPGRKEVVVSGVVAAWEQDTSGAAQTMDGVNRAALANAFTRYAHEGGLDPWAQDQLQAEAGLLLYGRGRYGKIPLLSA